MLSIGEFAKTAKVSSRTIRYYESIGLLPKSNRGENNYRFYDQKHLARVERIRDLQSLGFSLEDIKTIIDFADSELGLHLREKLSDLDREVVNLSERRSRILNLLSVTTKMAIGESLTETERNLFMEDIREEIFAGLRNQYNVVPESTIAYLDRDIWLSNNLQARDFISAIKKCVEFANVKNLKLGFARGSAPASLSLYGLGLSGVDPLRHEMIPERLASQKPIFHIDVEYDRGQEFVDFCKEVNKGLSFGEIQAFKMPLIDIVQNTQKAIAQEIEFESIDDNAEVVLSPFRQLDFEKIFQFDFSEDSLVMNFERFKPEYFGLEKMLEHFQGQRQFHFRDIINITALWRPSSNEIIDRINLYKQAKAKPFSYGLFSEKIESWLKPNFGMVIYHEDLIKIISEYTGWNYMRSNALRRSCILKEMRSIRHENSDWQEFQRIAPQEIVDFIDEESKWSFCLPHAISFAKFTKQTAVLKSICQKEYYAEIHRFEQRHGIRWDDIGIRIKGVSLHQG